MTFSQLNRTFPPESVVDDDGSADPDVVSALAAYERTEGGPADVLAALAGGRLLVPVVATPAGRGAATSMVAVSTVGHDGRRGLLVFTCLESMRRWNPDARPVPVSTRTAAESALADGADALVIDLAGPVLFSVDAEGLRALASGYRPVVAWGMR